VPSKNPTALGCYIFAGGFTLGVKRAGFEVLAQLEDGMFGVETTRRNHPGLPVFTSPADWPLEKFARKVDFVYGNPPCAPWSGSAISYRNKGEDFKTKYKRDPRTSCVYALFDVLHKVRPKVWAWESVTPALRKGHEMVKELTDAAAEMGYSATYVLLNAIDLGAPQFRYRFFCVFHKVDIDWVYPRVETHTTVRDVIGYGKVAHDMLTDVLPLGKNFNKILSYTRPGEGLHMAWNRANPPETRELNERGHVKGRPAFSQFRLRWDKPAGTMIGGAHIFHPDERRPLSVPEAAVICTYPQDYEFIGRVGERYLQIARAVMPDVGQWLGENVRRAVVRNKRIRKPRTWLRNFHKDIHYEVDEDNPPRI
jgi:DNA (cytosine-5)-methyltransferase 1